MTQCNVKWSLWNLALGQGATDDRTRDCKSLLSLADIPPVFILVGVKNQGKKWNRRYLYFKLTLCYIKAKLALFEKDTSESQRSPEMLSAPYTTASAEHSLSRTQVQPHDTEHCLRYLHGTAASLHCACQTHITSECRGPLKKPRTSRKEFLNWKGWKSLDTEDRIRHKKNTTYNLLLLSNCVVTELLRYFSKSKVEASLFPCLVPMYVKQNHKIHTVLERKDILWL